MTLDEIKNMIREPQYDFLRQNEHLGDNIIFITLGGSHAYGTNVDGSDVDIRGCALNRDCDILGLSNFEQFVNTETDTTIYGFNKLIKLLMNCNPNTIEMLGCKPEHYLYLSSEGREFIQNKKMFLSKKAVDSFGGYATQQLRRLENAVARDRFSQEMKEKHIMNSTKHAMKSFEDRYKINKSGSIQLYLRESERDDLDVELVADINLNGYPVREFTSVMNELSNVVKTYDKLNHRNRKKDSAHLNKHAMHLVRLYFTCIDILEKEDVITYRDADLPLLMKIRNGYFQNDDGTYRKEFFEMIDDLENRLQYAKENTSLPSSPNYKKVEEFVMEMNRKVIQGRA